LKNTNRLKKSNPNFLPSYSEDSQGGRKYCWCACHAKQAKQFSQKKLKIPKSPNITLTRVTAENKDITKSKAGPSTISLSGFFTFKKEKFHRIEACRNSFGKMEFMA